MAQYVIINIETIHKRIEELEKTSKRIFYGIDEYDFAKEELEKILSQSTPLLPEVSKAYDAGMLHKELSQMFDYPKGRYVNNLKLDI